MAFSPAINTATRGVPRDDAGVASAIVNTMQQVGGSVGTALLSTIAATATRSYATSHPGQVARSAAAVRGYTAAFTLAGCTLAAGAVIAFALLQGRPPGRPVIPESAAPVRPPQLVAPARARPAAAVLPALVRAIATHLAGRDSAVSISQRR